MLAAILGGLLGAALGVGLYRLGWYAARRTPRGGGVPERTSSSMTPLSGQELYNFLNYDGGEMPKEVEQPKNR